MCLHYTYQAKRQALDGSYGHYWVNPNNKVALAFGFDNSFFYMALVPTLLWSYDEQIRYPDIFLTNYFYLLDGKKFSTSRNHAVWGDELLEKVNADVIRLYLAFTRPEQNESNFTNEEFEQFVLEIGVQKLDRLLQRVCLLQLRYDEKKSSFTPMNISERSCIERFNMLIAEAELALDPRLFSLNELSDVLSRYVSLMSHLVDDLESSMASDVRIALAGIRGMAQILFPICPEYAGLIFRALQLAPVWTSNLDVPMGPLHLDQLPSHYFLNGIKK